MTRTPLACARFLFSSLVSSSSATKPCWLLGRKRDDRSCRGLVSTTCMITIVEIRHTKFNIYRVRECVREIEKGMHTERVRELHSSTASSKELEGEVESSRALDDAGESSRDEKGEISATCGAAFYRQYTLLKAHRDPLAR